MPAESGTKVTQSAVHGPSTIRAVVPSSVRLALPGPDDGPHGQERDYRHNLRSQDDAVDVDRRLPPNLVALEDEHAGRLGGDAETTALSMPFALRSLSAPSAGAAREASYGDDRDPVALARLPEDSAYAHGMCRRADGLFDIHLTELLSTGPDGSAQLIPLT
jgi:hypothetical protein